MLILCNCARESKPIRVETNEADCTIHCHDNEKCIYEIAYYEKFYRKKQYCIPYIKPVEYCSENSDCAGMICDSGVCVKK